MAKLHSIYISGIRSFGIEKEDAQVIRFHSPLTVFLGQNGCGKTTIIESVKHACTGDLPGGTVGTKAGQGFVSDPTLHQVNQVMGQIKMIIQVPDAELTVTRIMRCVKSKDDMRFSTMDTSLKVKKKPGGEEQIVSGRTLDINNTLIQFLGVPKAILNNVIFCHQENSLWPLEESSKLKAKFDEIFDSAKYTKVVELLRQQFKHCATVIKVLKQDVLHMKDKKEEVDRKKAKLDEMEQKMNEYVVNIDGKNNEIEPIKKRLKEIEKFEEGYQVLSVQYSRKEEELRNIVKMQKTLKDNIKVEFEGSDEDLKNEIDSFSNKMKAREAEIKEVEKNKEDLTNAEKGFQIKMQQVTVSIAKIKQQTEDFEKMKTERDKLVTELTTMMKLDLNDVIEMEERLETIKTGIDKEEKSLNEMKIEFENGEKEAQEQIDVCRVKVSESNQKIKSKREQVVDLQKQSRLINSQLEELNVSDAELKKYTKKLEQVGKEIDHLSKSMDEKQMESDIKKENMRIKTLQQQLEDVEAEFKVLQKNYLIDNDIEGQKSNILKKDSEIKKIKLKHHDEFLKLFKEFPDNNLKDAVRKLQVNHQNSITTNDRNIEKSQKNVTTFEAECKHLNKKFVDNQAELTKYTKEVTKLCGKESYSGKVMELKDKVNQLQKERGQYSSLKIIYEKLISDISKSKCCPICNTDFKAQEDAVEMVKAGLLAKIHDIPSSLAQVEKAIQETEHLYKKLLEAKPLNDRIEELSHSNPIQELELKKKKDLLKEMETKLNKLKESQIEPREMVKVCSNIIADCAVLDQQKNEIVASKADILNLEKQLVTVESNKSRQEVEIEIEKLKSDVSEARQKYDKLTTRLDQHRKRMNSLKEENNRLREQQLRVEKLMHGRPQLEESVKSIEEQEHNLQSEIEGLQAILQELKNDLQEAQETKEIAKSVNNVQLESASKDLNKFRNRYSEIVKLQKQINNIAQQDLQQKFNNDVDELSDCKVRQKNIEQAKNTLIKQFTDLQLQLANQESSLRQLKENVALREKRVEQRKLQQEVNQLKEKVGKQNYDEIKKEKDELHVEYTQLFKQLQIIEGKKAELMSTKEDVASDLELPHNKNVYTDYRNKEIELRIHTITHEDIKLYMESLDNAIIMLHSNRMKQINKTIKQLWRQIYRGNDIDYIEIDSGNIEHTLTSKRSYNYKVMQMKRDTLLEMRGRCSAGQKVLACLIIRIALSETFSSNCGILALDEPTTNLDRENVESLSHTLARIIKSREAQKNFQLLIITHDEEFLRALRSVDSIKEYYKVSRSVKGTTVITTEAL